MLGKLVGAMHKKGNFTNEKTGEVIAYDNIELVILSPIKTGGQYDPVAAVGLSPDKNTKFRAEKLSEVFGEQYNTLDSISPLLGSDIEYFFDSSKKICRVMKYGK